MKSSIRSIKGTRDFYPEDMSILTWLQNTIREVSESFGYQEFEGPFLESVELYAAKSGEELVKEQSFVFPDRGGDLITLRPELTPTLARMVAQRQRQLIFPLRWWSFGPFWRYERPQKGRSREFFQWNIDLIGVDSPEADAELIAILATFFQKVGLSADKVNILVNDRRLMNIQFENLGIPAEQRPALLRLIDRRDRMSPEDWARDITGLGVIEQQIDALKIILSDDQLWRQSENLSRVFAALEALGVSDYIRYAPYIIRGLDYYTGTVFEAWDTAGEFRAILGGGRYDNLVADVGGDPLPGVGYAMGDFVISLVLDKFGLIPAGMERLQAPVLVTVFDDSMHLPALRLATELRLAGLKVAIFPEPARLGKQFKYADRIGARIAVVLGPEEYASQQVAIKDLGSGEQQTVARSVAASRIAELLETVRSS